MNHYPSLLANLDNDSTNEIQTISLNNDTISLSNGGGSISAQNYWEKNNNTISNKSGYVSIGTKATDSSAIVNISSSTAGILMPRLSSTQRQGIFNPANGLLVFDITTSSFWYFSNVWTELISTNNNTSASSSSEGLIYTVNGF